MKSEYLELRKICGLNPIIQVWIIVFLYLATVIWCWFEYKTTGKVFQNYPVLITIFFAPIIEEVLFRGIIQPRFITQNGVWNGIIQTSILFGLWHIKNIFWYGDISGLLQQMIYTGIIFGPIIGYLAYRLKNIRPGVILHYVHNLALGIILYIL